MPRLNIDGVGEVDAEVGKRLVLALCDNGADNLHACGDSARCTTCRVQFIWAEPKD
mgnify:FL=1|jgi:ferredoxin